MEGKYFWNGQCSLLLMSEGAQCSTTEICLSIPHSYVSITCWSPVKLEAEYNWCTLNKISHWNFINTQPNVHLWSPIEAQHICTNQYLTILIMILCGRVCKILCLILHAVQCILQDPWSVYVGFFFGGGTPPICYHVYPSDRITR